MDSVSALTSLLQVENGVPAAAVEKSKTSETLLKTDAPSNEKETSEGDENKTEPKKRFIPEHKKPDAALTFPEKLMSLMRFAEDHKEDNFCVAWLEDGKSFVIRNPDEFTRKVLPKYFKATKFSSFTRKLYRWGFRQVNRGIGPDDPIIFGNEYFQRDNQELMTKMRSITAATTRKQEQSNMQIFAQKRALECMDAEQNHKRILLDQMIMQQQKAALNQNMFQNGGMNLTSALRPNLGNPGFNGMGGMGGMNGMKSFDMGAMNGMKSFDMGAMNGMKSFDMGGMNGMKSFDMFGQGLSNSNPLMNAAFPSMSQGGLGGLSNSNSQYSNAASTADIVNAAINALRYAP